MPDRNTVPRACSIVLPPLQRSNTGPHSPGHVLQFCPLFREARQDHSPQGMFYSLSPLQRSQTGPQFPGHVLQSSPSSEKPDWTTVPRACSTALPPLQRSQKAAVAPWRTLQEQLWDNTEHLLKTTAFLQTTRLTI